MGSLNWSEASPLEKSLFAQCYTEACAMDELLGVIHPMPVDTVQERDGQGNLVKLVREHYRFVADEGTKYLIAEYLNENVYWIKMKKVAEFRNRDNAQGKLTLRGSSYRLDMHADFIPGLWSVTRQPSSTVDVMSDARVLQTYMRNHDKLHSVQSLAKVLCTGKRIEVSTKERRWSL